MKKLLALVLALVMTLSLCVVSSNAAFDDAADINYDEAVDVMAGLQILEGYDTGDFKPATVLNREQAAKIITYMQLGKKTADALSVKSSFTDTQGNWADSYIAYAASQGIIAGVGDNKFNPKGELTGYAFAKMVLCALGYDADYEGLTGSDWMIKTAKLVNSLKLNDGMEDVSLSAGMTREQASQMAFNGLFERTQNFKKGTTVAGTGLTISVGGEYGPTTAPLFVSVFGGQTDEGIVTLNASNDTTSAKNGTTTITPIGGAPKTVSLVTDADLFGKYVEVYYKDAYTSAAKPGTAYAIVDKTIETKVTKDMTAKELKNALSADKYNVANPAEIFTTKYQNGATAATPKTVTYGTTSGAGLGACTLYGYYDSVNKVAVAYGYAVADTYTVDKVTAISTVAGKESITLNGAGAKQNNATNDVVNEYDGIAKDDLVAVYTYGTGGTTVYNLVKLDKVTGKATAVSVKAGSESVTVNGTVYSFSGATDNSGETTVAAGAIGYTDEYELYLDKDGEVALVKGVAAESDLVYVVATYTTTATGDYGAGASKYFVQGVNTAGEEVKYQVYHASNGYFMSKAAATANIDNTNEIVAGTLYSVTTAYDSTAKATMAEFAAVGSSTKVAERQTNSVLDKKAVKSAGGHYFASDVQFIFVEDTLADMKVTVVDGVCAIPGTTTYTVYGTKAASASIYDVHYVFVSAAPTAATTSEIVFANESSVSTSKVPYTDADGNTAVAFQHTVYVDGVKTTILTTANTAISGFKKLTTNETTGITTYINYSNTTTATAATNQTVTKVYNGLLTDGTVIDADLASAKIVDLTDNGIDTVAGLKSLVGCGGTVEVAYVYDNTNTQKVVSILYITDATFTATLTNAGNDMTAAVTANTFGTANKNIAVDGLSYKWTNVDTGKTVADETTATMTGTTGVTYKCTITVTTTTGEVFEATTNTVTL